MITQRDINKMFKFTIYILSVLSTMLMAQTGISKSILNGSVEGEVELFYYNIDKDTDENIHATALGGFLKYTTDTNNSFFASLRLHTSNLVGSSANVISTSLFNNDKKGDALHAVSESFIAYKTSHRVMKIGNVMLNTPLMNDNRGRIVPWSYQGFTYTGDVMKNLRVQVYHINAIRSNTSSEYKKESGSGKIGDAGISMLSFHYDDNNGIHLQSYYYYAPSLYSTFVAQADYEFRDANEVHYCLGIQYFNSSDGGKYADKTNKDGGDDIDLVALRVTVDIDDLYLSLNYSQNFGVSGIVKAYGGLAKVYTSSMIANGRGNSKPKTWMLKTTYELPITSNSSEIALNLTTTRLDENSEDDYNAYYLHYRYYFNNDTSVLFRYENMNYLSDKSDASYFRIISTYRF